jgi:hypothetical protein
VTDSSTIPVTIGLDVLEQLIDMAKPQLGQHVIYLEMARNAATEAGASVQLTEQVERDIRFTQELLDTPRL